MWVLLNTSRLISMFGTDVKIAAILIRNLVWIKFYQNLMLPLIYLNKKFFIKIQLPS